MKVLQKKFSFVALDNLIKVIDAEQQQVNTIRERLIEFSQKDSRGFYGEEQSLKVVRSCHILLIFDMARAKISLNHDLTVLLC